jgi:hypothetical protein
MPKHLDFNAPQKVEYCIPLWMRDLQVQASTKRIKDRIQSGAIRTEPIACVSYGPSLAQTWEQIKDFDYVMTCSGAHKFLVERGIIPNWHVEVDPRPHKVELIGPPQLSTTYLIASTCHAAVFDHLEGYTVKLWHVFDGSDDGIRLLPPEEWAITGGSSVGLRTMTLARFLGFTNLHVFGMDGCEGPTGKHAAEHPNQPKDYVETEYDGVTYRTTTSMLVCAKSTWHELDQLSDVTAKFYGEGLVQHMARHYVRTPKQVTPIGFVRPELISPEYVALNAQLHEQSMVYGVGGAKHAPTVLKLVDSIKPKSVLDYGCGKGLLAKELPFPIWEYDPAIPLKAEPPRPAELVICTDVLEHIEPDKLQAVLMDLHRVTRKVGYFVIHTGPANKTLPDGRNTHLIQKGEAWWRKNLERYFQVASVNKKGHLLHIVVGPKGAKRQSVKQSVAAGHVVEAMA